MINTNIDKHMGSSTRRIQYLHQSLLLFISLVATWTIVSFSITFLECPLIIHPFISIDVSRAISDKTASFQPRLMYIPGAGFSGFFYTLGRLHSIRQNDDTSTLQQYDDEYYCFSAGCLALVATLMEVPLHSAIEMALSSRGRWMREEIGRYDIVENFVDSLLMLDGENETYEMRSNLTHRRMVPNEILYDFECAQYHNNYTAALTSEVQMPCLATTISTNQPLSLKFQHLLSKINIITTSWNKNKNNKPIMSQSIQSPSTLLNLKEILLQTTYIPFITGPTLGRFDASTGTFHNDGAFVTLVKGWKPLLRKAKRYQNTEARIIYSLKLPWDAELMFHGLNMALDSNKAEHFWERGVLRGI